MVAHYANCAVFPPPRGTQALCQRIASSQRPGINFYLYDPDSPAQRAFGYFKQDGKVGAFAEQVVFHELGRYLRNVAANLAAYFVPSSYPNGYGGCGGYTACGLTPELDWTRDDPAEGQLVHVMERFYAPFRPRSRASLRRLLGDWQQVFRFGAVLLAITTLLSVAALLLPGRRAPLVLFGGGALSLLIAPSVIGDYVGRYSVPMAAPMLASAAIAGQQLWIHLRRRGGHRPECSPT